MGNDLAQRVRDNTLAQQHGTVSLETQVRRMEDQFKLAMPRGAEAAQLVRDAITCLRQTPALARCDAKTVLGGLMTCAQLGLRPGVLGHAWLIPFHDRKTNQHNAQLVIGYQGLVELAHRSGKLDSLIARTVHEHDEFEVDYGLADSLVHKPRIFGERGEAIAFYAIAKFTSGGHAFIVMSADEMRAYRSKHAKAKNSGPWVDHFEAMAHKTCVRQLAKWMPKSTEFAAAIEADNSIRVDIAPDTDIAIAGTQPVIEGEVIQPDATRGDVDTDTGEILR